MIFSSFFRVAITILWKFANRIQLKCRSVSSNMIHDIGLKCYKVAKLGQLHNFLYIISYLLNHWGDSDYNQTGRFGHKLPVPCPVIHKQIDTAIMKIWSKECGDDQKYVGDKATSHRCRVSCPNPHNIIILLACARACSHVILHCVRIFIK